MSYSLNSTFYIFHGFWINYLSFFPHEAQVYATSKNTCKETEVLLQIQRCNYRCACLLNTCPKHTLSGRLLLILPPLKLNAQLVSLNILLCYRRAATALCLENNHWVASRQTLFKVQISFHLMWLLLYPSIP